MEVKISNDALRKYRIDAVRDVMSQMPDSEVDRIYAMVMVSAHGLNTEKGGTYHEER